MISLSSDELKMFFSKKKNNNRAANTDTVADKVLSSCGKAKPGKNVMVIFSPLESVFFEKV